MFNKLSEKEILKRLNKNGREKEIAHIPSSDNFYLYFLSNFEGIEITPDIHVFGNEDAIRENQYLEFNYPDIANFFWLIGSSGQGDKWLIKKGKGTICFYDHDQGEYVATANFTDLSISFLEFLQMAFLFADLEKVLDEQDDEIQEQQKDEFKETLSAINDKLSELYPYQYF